MHDTECFVFGTRIFEQSRRDAVSSLPLEILWKIFSYLNKASLASASYTCKLWRRIILANRKLRSRINIFELSEKLGSKSLVKFIRRNKRILKKVKTKNYVSTGACTVPSTKPVIKSKRSGEDIIACTKRYKIF